MRLSPAFKRLRFRIRIFVIAVSLCVAGAAPGQLQVIKRMVADLLLPLEIVGIETVREPDGLAMSSRNRFLNAADRATAPLLNRVLRETANALIAGGAAEPLLEAGRQALSEAGFVVDYLALVDGPSLVPIETASPTARLIATARLGGVRLLDNVPMG